MQVTNPICALCMSEVTFLCHFCLLWCVSLMLVLFQAREIGSEVQGVYEHNSSTLCLLPGQQYYIPMTPFTAAKNKSENIWVKTSEVITKQHFSGYYFRHGYYFFAVYNTYTLLLCTTRTKVNFLEFQFCMVGVGTKNYTSVSYLILRSSSQARVSESFQQDTVKLGEFVVCAAECDIHTQECYCTP